MSVYDTYRTILSISAILTVISLLISIIFIKIEDKISIRKEHICDIFIIVFLSIGFVFFVTCISTLFIVRSHKYNRYKYDIDSMIKDYNITRIEYSSEVTKSNVDYVVKYTAFGHEEWIHFIKKTDDTDKYLVKTDDANKYLIKK